MSSAASVPAPAFHDLVAPAEWAAIDFISDIHLAPDMPRTRDAWAGYLKSTPADAVLILGDLFDVWVGDDSRLEGFEAECTAVLRQAAHWRRVGFMVGNRDFLLGAAMLEDCGLMAMPDPTVLQAFGQRMLLAHGDALCIADTEYQRFRAMVRSPQWQATALALPLAERRRLAAQMRHASEQRNAQGMLPAEAADVDAATATAWMRAAATPVLVHGHTHRPGSAPLAPGFMRHVLSDWDLDHAGTAARAEVLRLTREGFARLDLAQASRHPALP
ncbi:MAG: UDP-2,3-diacylglucosamine diphosphatase [Rhizobacter sp.]|nr:UDP-2,3-diacylglucosamine diphosphatase [Rhizobacter sp.]